MHIEKYLHKHYSKYLSKAKEDLLQKWKELDDKLHKKRSKHLVIKDYCNRTIWTPYTDLLTFSRRRYFDKKKKVYRYLLDEHLALDKYKFISRQYQKLAIFHFDKFRSYKDIAKIIFNDRVSKMSIHNFIISHKPKFTMQNYLCNQDGILWINCDGMWIKRNKTTKAVEVKSFVLFTGRDKDSMGRYQLKGKTLKHFTNVSTDKIADVLEHIILQYDDVREIRLVGDGANWIKQIAKKLGATFYIDKFHYHKTINDLLGIKSKNKKYVYDLLDQELPKPTLKYKLLQLVANETTGEIKQRHIKLIGYLINNYHYYLRNVKYDNPINCIEAIQAHHLAKYLKNQRKGWSLKVLKSIITFLYSQSNQGESIDVDIGNKISYPTFNYYGISASMPGVEELKMARLFNKKI